MDPPLLELAIIGYAMDPLFCTDKKSFEAPLINRLLIGMVDVIIVTNMIDNIGNLFLSLIFSPL